MCVQLWRREINHQLLSRWRCLFSIAVNVATLDSAVKTVCVRVLLLKHSELAPGLKEEKHQLPWGVNRTQGLSELLSMNG